MRNNSIDNVRGFAMLVIISWHVLNIHSPWTDTWTMPVFFVIMGLFYKPTDWRTLVQKKLVTLVIPWLFFSIPDFVMRIVNHGMIDVIKVIANPYKYIHAGSWFVACTLWIYCIAYCLYQIKSIRIRTITTWVMIAGGFVLSSTHIFGHRAVLPFNIHSAMCMFLFFEMGRLFKDEILYTSIRKSIVYACLGFCLCAVDITLLGGVKPFNIIWVSWQQNEVMLVLRLLVGCAMILSICNLLPKIPVVSYIGRYSLIVLLSHFYFINVLKSLGLHEWILYIATVIITLFFTYLSVRFIPQLVGVNINRK